MPAPPAGLDLPVGFAHRGARAEQRENTLAAFSRALELGAPGLESDAWLTRDGVVVLDHDGTVRSGWRHRPIATRLTGQLPAHVPRLTDLYRHCGTDFQLSLDLKDPAAAPAVVQAAGEAGARSRLWLCAGGVEVLEPWRARWPDLHLVASTRRARLGSGGLARLHRAGLDAVNLRGPEWDAPLVAEAHGAGLLAFAWDAQRPAQLDRLLGLGVDALYCDHPLRLREALARHARRRRQPTRSEPVEP